MRGGGYEYRFCPYCGTLMDLPLSGNLMECPLCRSQHKLASDASVVTTSGPEDLMRRYGLEPLVPLAVAEAYTRGGGERAAAAAADGTGVVVRERAKVSETCPKCGNKEMEYYTMQLRSADEGQTVFYECVKCRHKYSLNT